MTSTTLAFEAAVCCACGHRAADPFITAEDDLTGCPGRFTFRRCRACGLVYQTPRLTIERVKDYYDDDYLAHRQRSDWGWMSPFFHWALGSIDREKLRICSRYLALDTSSAVLDVGCGGGTFLARLRERHGAAGVGVDSWISPRVLRCATSSFTAACSTTRTWDPAGSTSSRCGTSSSTTTLPCGR